MIWLSQAELRRDAPQARQLAAQLLLGARQDASHALVWNLFSSDPQVERDFLYREVDLGRYLIVSQREPDQQSPIWSVKSRPYAPELTAGQIYGFSLRANPTVAISQPGRARSHRADVIMAAKTRARHEGRDFTAQDRVKAAKDWLMVREQRLGVRFVQGSDGVQVGRIDQVAVTTKGRQNKVTCVDYQGGLEVTDPALLTQALRQGVGRSKAFGMGLMLLRHQR